ncbi:MAG: hypothetical protein Q4E13_13145 [Clostridia bacterium]|nr:hypothetical protein [Clostridia bacterium]
MKHIVHLAGNLSNLFRQLPTCDRFEMDPNEIHRLSVAMQGRI